MASPEFEDITANDEFFRSRTFKNINRDMSDVSAPANGYQASREVQLALVNFQRQISTRRGLSNCGVARRNKNRESQLHKLTYADGHSFAYISNIQVCRSGECVSCSEVKAFKEQVRIAYYLEAAIEAGFELDFVTLTIQSEAFRVPKFYSQARDFALTPSPEYEAHLASVENDDDPLYTEAEAFSDWLRVNDPVSPNSWSEMPYEGQSRAIQAATGELWKGSFQQDSKEKFGLVGSIHVLEDLFIPSSYTADGRPDFTEARINTGKHMVIVRTPDARGSRDEFHERIIKKFMTSVGRRGQVATRAHQDAQWIQTDDPEKAIHAVSNYLPKQIGLFGLKGDLSISTDEGEAYTASGVLWEAFAGNSSALELWRNYENARFNQKRIVYSQKLWESLGVSKEPPKPKRVVVSDDVEANLPPETVVALHAKPQAKRMLLNAVENAPTVAAGSRKLLDNWGLDYEPFLSRDEFEQREQSHLLTA